MLFETRLYARRFRYVITLMRNDRIRSLQLFTISVFGKIRGALS